MKIKKLIWMATEVDEQTAREFDKIADKHLRNRARQMEYLIKKEVANQNDKSKMRG